MSVLLKLSTFEFGLIILIVTIAMLFAATVCFALYATGLRVRNIIRQDRRHELESRWVPVIVQVADGTVAAAELTELARNLPRVDKLFFIELICRYLRRLKGSEYERLAESARPFTPLLMEEAQNKEPEERAIAIQSLALIDAATHTHRIVKALDDASPLVAMVAARGLINLKNTSAYEEVLRRIGRFSTWSHSYLVSMVVNMGIAACPLLRNLLASDEPPRVRAIAADALAELADPYASLPALQVLMRESDRNLLAATLRLVEKIGTDEHLSEVRRLASSTDFAVRAMAARVLGSVGGRDDADLLIRSFDDESPWVALNAARALSAMNRKDVLAEFVRAGHARAALAKQVLTS